VHSRSPPPRRGYSPDRYRERGDYGRPPYDYHREPYYDDRRGGGGGRGGYYRDYDDRRMGYGRPQYRENYRGYHGGGGNHVPVDSRELTETTDLFVGNLPPTFREHDLYSLFEKCGKVLNVTLGINRRTRMSKCYAFVRYENRRDAEEAFNYFQDKTFDGRTLRIDWDIGQEKKAKRHTRRPHYQDYGRGRSRSPSPREGGPPRIYGRGRSRSPEGGPQRTGNVYARDRSRSISPQRRSHSKSPTRYSRSPRRVEEFEKRSRSPPNETQESYKKAKLDERD
jgi:RNA recognition motif-containing protein